MIEVRIFDYETKALRSRFQMKDKNCKDISRASSSVIFNILHRIGAMQQSKDILGIGILGDANIGIDRMFRHGWMTSSIESDSTLVLTGPDSFELYAKPCKVPYIPRCVTIDGVDTGIRLGIVLYEPGWLLKFGKTGYNILGTPYDSYLSSARKGHLHLFDKSCARKFKNLNDVEEFLRLYYDLLGYAVKEYFCNWSLEPSCEFFMKDLEYSLKGSRLKKHEDKMQTIQDLLVNINSMSEPASPDCSNLPEEVNADTIRSEILYRMRSLNMWNNVIEDFRTVDKVFQSEGGGIVYELDDNAKIAVDQAVKAGLHPWHVIKNHFEFGIVYAVLYVSEYVNEWPCERASKEGYCSAFCWNSDQKFYEIGDICIAHVNGGLVRTA